MMDHTDAATSRDPAPLAHRESHEPAPGGPEARDSGCCCSVLANAGHRVDPDVAALIDPACPVHTTSARSRSADPSS